MAGPDTKLSSKIITTTTSGGYLHIIIPDGGGGFDSNRILASTFLAALDIVTVSLVSQSSDFNFAIDAGDKLLGMDFEWQASSPLIKVGTTPGGDEISLAQLPVPTSEYLVVNIDKIMKITTTVYVSITGGTVNIKRDHQTNRF